MPYGKRNNKRKNYNRRRNRGYAKRSSQINYTREIFPKRMLRKFVYTDIITLNQSVLGVIPQHVFRLNSLFDPDYTGTGHQPMGFDELIPYYNHYYVLSAKINCAFNPDNETGGWTFGVAIRDTITTMGNDINTILENPNTKYKTMTYGAYQDNKDIMISYPVSVKKFLGVDKVIDNKDLSGTQSTNPAEDVTAHIFCRPNDSTTAPTVLTQVNVRIEFIAMLTEPKPLQGS